MVTLKELVDGLAVILKEHPELADRKICVASECGGRSAGLESPVVIVVPIFTSDFQDYTPYIRIVSDDDGYWIDRVVANWEFISSEGD